MSETEAVVADAETATNTGADEAARQTVATSVGQRLRAAREAAGLSLADVAQSLKYGARQIEQLEADDYASLPGNTIVRGFTRSYARLLGLDGEELVRQLDTRTPNELADVRPPENMGIADDETGLRLSPLASAAIVLVLAALLLALWHFFGPKPSKSSMAGGEPSVAQSQVTAPQEAVPMVQLPPAGAAQPGAVADPAAAGPSLVFVFDDRSWLEVTDANKQIVHTGENPAGTRLTLSGKPPFDIVVGNAGKVKLSYGDRVVDLAPYTRAEVARLKLE